MPTQYSIEDAPAQSSQYAVEDAPATPAAPSLWQTMKNNFNANTQGAEHKPGESNAERFKTDVQNVGAGGGDVLRSLKHPINTAKGIAKSIEPDPGAAGIAESILGPAGPLIVHTVEGAAKDPARFVGQAGLGEIIGEAGGVAAAPKVAAEAAKRAVTEPAANVGRMLTKTTAKDTGKLVADVARGNEEAAGKAEGANAQATQEHLTKTQDAAAKAEAQRKVGLKKHFEGRNKAIDERQAAEGKIAAATENQNRIAPTKEKLDNAWSSLRAKVETARENALKEGNTKYNTVNEKLNHIPADMETVHALYGDAANAMGETQVQPPILKRIGTALEKGEQLSYKDLQGAYSELGKELSKGTLPGATYHAYDVLQEGIGADMQRIADSQGVGPQLADARNYWRRMKQTFGKPLAIRDAAGKTLKGSASDVAAADAQANQLRMLGSFDPTIPQQYGHVSNIEQGLDALPNAKPERELVEKAKPTPIPARKPILPKVQDVATAAAPDRPPVIPADTRTLTPTQLSQAKANSVFDSVNNVSRNGHTPTTTATILHAAKRMTVGKMLESPSVVNYLSTITPADVAQVMRLPEDQRAGFANIVKQAQAKGIKISPALGVLVGVNAPKRVAAALQP